MKIETGMKLSNDKLCHVESLKNKFFETWKEKNKDKLEKLYSVLESNNIKYEFSIIDKIEMCKKPGVDDDNFIINIDIRLLLSYSNAQADILVYSSDLRVYDMPSYLPQEVIDKIVDLAIYKRPNIADGEVRRLSYDIEFSFLYNWMHVFKEKVHALKEALYKDGFIVTLENESIIDCKGYNDYRMTIIVSIRVNGHYIELECSQNKEKTKRELLPDFLSEQSKDAIQAFDLYE